VKAFVTHVEAKRLSRLVEAIVYPEPEGRVCHMFHRGSHSHASRPRVTSTGSSLFIFMFRKGGGKREQKSDYYLSDFCFAITSVLIS
jgi:hypothetical protein